MTNISIKVMETPTFKELYAVRSTFIELVHISRLRRIEAYNQLSVVELKTTTPKQKQLCCKSFFKVFEVTEY